MCEQQDEQELTGTELTRIPFEQTFCLVRDLFKGQTMILKKLKILSKFSKFAKNEVKAVKLAALAEPGNVLATQHGALAAPRGMSAAPHGAQWAIR